MGGSSYRIVRLFSPALGTAMKYLGGVFEDDDGGSTTAPPEVPKPPMTEDAIAEAEKKLAGTPRKRKGMASTIFTSPAGAPLGGGNVANIFAQGA